MITNVEFDKVTIDVLNVIYRGKSILVAKPNKQMSIIDMENWRKLLKEILVNFGYDANELLVTTTYTNSWILEEEFKIKKNEKEI